MTATATVIEGENRFVVRVSTGVRSDSHFDPHEGDIRFNMYAHLILESALLKR